MREADIVAAITLPRLLIATRTCRTVKAMLVESGELGKIVSKNRLAIISLDDLIFSSGTAGNILTDDER